MLQLVTLSTLIALLLLLLFRRGNDSSELEILIPESRIKFKGSEQLLVSLIAFLVLFLAIISMLDSYPTG